MLSDKVTDPNKRPSALALWWQRAKEAILICAAVLVILGFGVAAYQHLSFEQLQLEAVSWAETDDEAVLEVVFAADTGCLINPWASTRAHSGFDSVTVHAAAVTLGGCDGPVEVTRTVELSGPLDGRQVLDGEGERVPRR